MTQSESQAENQARGETVVNAPAATIMGVITDFEAYPEWAENVTDVEIRERDEHGRARVVWMRVDARILDVEYVIVYEYGDDRLTWSLVEGEQLQRLDGEYLLTPEGDGRTRVRYTLAVEPVFPLPGFLKKRAAKQIMETGLGDLKRRAESLV